MLSKNSNNGDQSSLTNKEELNEAIAYLRAKVNL